MAERTGTAFDAEDPANPEIAVPRNEVVLVGRPMCGTSRNGNGVAASAAHLGAQMIMGPFQGTWAGKLAGSAPGSMSNHCALHCCASLAAR